MYNNIGNLIKLQNRMDTTFMNSESCKISDTHRLLVTLSDKIQLKRSDKYVTLSNLSIYYTWKNIKKSYILSCILSWDFNVWNNAITRKH